MPAGDRAILVGRGAADNDALTLHVGRPHDLWLHARGVTGAHVIVPLRRDEPCPGVVEPDVDRLVRLSPGKVDLIERLGVDQHGAAVAGARLLEVCERDLVELPRRRQGDGLRVGEVAVVVLRVRRGIGGIVTKAAVGVRGGVRELDAEQGLRAGRAHLRVEGDAGEGAGIVLRGTRLECHAGLRAPVGGTGGASEVHAEGVTVAWLW